MEPAPRITMRDEPPMLPELLIWRPATLPEMALIRFGACVLVRASADTVCCDVLMVAFSRCWLSAVTTTSLSWAGCEVRLKSVLTRPPVSVTGWRMAR